MDKEGNGSKTVPHMPFMAPETTSNRTYNSHWIEGSHELCTKSPKFIGAYMAEVIQNTQNIYAVTVMVNLGVHVTTMTEKKDDN